MTAAQASFDQLKLRYTSAYQRDAGTLMPLVGAFVTTHARDLALAQDWQAIESFLARRDQAQLIAKPNAFSDMLRGLGVAFDATARYADLRETDKTVKLDMAVVYIADLAARALFTQSYSDRLHNGMFAMQWIADNVVGGADLNTAFSRATRTLELIGHWSNQNDAGTGLRLAGERERRDAQAAPSRPFTI